MVAAEAKGPSVVPLLEVPMAPLHPSLPLPPLAVQEVALLLDHVSVVDCPVCSELGKAANDMMLGANGTLATATMTEAGALVPPGPVQASE